MSESISIDYPYYHSLLNNGRYINIASISNIGGILKPHCSVVFFHQSSDGLFWTSTRTCQHSLNFAFCPNASVVLYEENLKEGTGDRKGLYFEGNVRVLKDKDEIENAKILSTKKANKDRSPEDQLQTPDPEKFMEHYKEVEEIEEVESDDGIAKRAVYHFRPTRVWTNTWSPEMGDSRIELSLDEIMSEKMIPN